MKKFDNTVAFFSAIMIVIFLSLVVALLLLLSKEEEPAQINVRCVGDHLLFESERTGDIQVIPNKCKKQYSRNQAPVTR